MKHFLLLIAATFLVPVQAENQWKLTDTKVKAFEQGFYKMSEEYFMDEGSPRLWVITKTLDIYATDGSDESVTETVVPFAGEATASLENFNDVKEKMVSVYARNSSTLDRAQVEKVQEAIREDLKTTSYYNEYQFENYYYFVNLYAHNGPLTVYKGPFEGTYIIVSSTAYENAARGGFIYVIDYRTPYLSGEPLEYRSAGKDLPINFSVKSVEINDRQIVIADSQGQQIVFLYDMSQPIPKLNEPNFWDNLTGGSEVDASTLQTPDTLIEVQDNYQYLDYFTGAYIQNLNDMYFGINNKGTSSFLTVVDAKLNLLFEQDLGKQLIVGSASDPYAADNIHTYPYGVVKVFEAPNKGDYRKEKIEYVVLLSDGIIYTLNKK